MILEPYTSIVVKRALNYQLKKMTKDVLIKKVESVDENFHARFSCLGRSYVYKIVSSPEGDGFPFESDLRWFVGKKLDVERMLEASQIFVGTHDFTTFSSLNPVWSFFSLFFFPSPFPFQGSSIDLYQSVDLGQEFVVLVAQIFFFSCTNPRHNVIHEWTGSFMKHSSGH
eukprot:TRINITY_DN591_c0_g1_i6.p1 TRINITY_DN591_c0_g1~~TRINITY_DN591_c0_g1_i6.p1  ORF type:complete len:170 (-),score=17.33 TRINITY_DN591_c0_g1_i6:463-972(-)